jgi:nickel/cobalt transporter (NicO) family protein
MRGLLLCCMMFFLCLSILPPQAHAQQPADSQKKTVIIDKRKLLVQPRNSDGSLISPTFREDPVLWMSVKQQNFYASMSNSIRQMKSANPSEAAWTLLTISFFYGIFHAAGPGHGKVVVTGWLLATENELKRGIAIAFLSAMFQALTAIVAVSAIFLFVQGATTMAKNVAGFLESASYLMIAGMGLYLLWNGWSSTRPKPVSLSAAASGPFELVSRPQSGAADHIHDENCGCGHAHVPAASAVRGDWSWSRAFAMAFAVGIRPCSGAILVLVGSYTLGLFWAGVLSTLAMGLGVFITISTIATLAVYAKTTALRLAGADSVWTRLAVTWGKMAAGVAIAGLGALLFLGSLNSNNLGM